MKRVLCIDDEPNLLAALERQLRKQFDIHTAVGPEAGLQKIATDGPFAVVVSDLRMPGMTGIEFLSRVRKKYPDTVRIMLTGQADLSTAIGAVNEGNIFQFLTKPCPTDVLARALTSALEQHQLVCAERELLEKTLRGSIGVMIEILSLVNPPAFSKAHRIRKYVLHMVSKLNLEGQWQYEMAAMLSQIGCVGVPPEIIEKRCLGGALTREEETVLQSQGRVGQNLLSSIPRLEVVAGMIGKQSAAWNHNIRANDAVTIGGHLVQIALDLDGKITGGADPQSILGGMARTKRYNIEFLGTLQDFPFDQYQGQSRAVTVAQLKSGMVVAADVYGKNGVLVLAKDQEVTPPVMARLQSFAITAGIVEPLLVAARSAGNAGPEEDAADLQPAAEMQGTSV